MKKTRSGFTLIEIILVMGILSVLTAIVLVAINPSQQFQQANNTKRKSDINALLDAIDQYAIANKGVFPGTITTTTKTIGNAVGQLDICSFLVPQYLAALPVDPGINSGTAITNCAASYNTGYTASQSATDNRLILVAPSAQAGAYISVQR